MAAPRMPRKLLMGLMMAAVFAWVGYGSFLATRELTDSGTSEADPAQPNEPAPQGSPVIEHQRMIDESAKPRFEGELLGIYLGPDLAKAPAGAVERNEQLRAEWTSCFDAMTQRPVETAQRFGLDFAPPPGFVLSPYQVHAHGVISAVGVCSRTGVEVGASWDLTTAGNGRASVLRTFPMTVWQLDVSAERVKTITAGGQEAILVEPVNPEDGYGSFALVMFPRDDSFTYIHTNDVALAKLLELAETVGQALAKAGS